jgi:hypothetical protein
MTDDNLFDDLFLNCAWSAFLEQAHRQQGWPDMEATRLLAYHFYEEALADKNRRRSETSAPESKILTLSAKRAKVEP